LTKDGAGCRLTLLARGGALLDSSLFLADRGLRRSLADQPFRRIGKQFFDLLGGQRLRDTSAGEAGRRDSELSRDDETGMRTVQSQLGEPVRRGREQLVQLLASARRRLELFWHSGKVDAEFLRHGRGLQGLRGLRGHLRQRSLSLVTADQPALRIAFAPGVTPAKWTRRWAERHPELPLEVFPVAEEDGVAVLRERAATLSFVRLPIDRDGLSVIRLYGEVAVLVVPRDSELATLEALTEVQVADLVQVAGYSPQSPVKDAVALVAAGVGFLRLPHSLARLNARKDVVAIPIEDAPETEIALSWLRDETTELIEEFVGIVRGRTEASSRANPTPPTPKVRPRREAKPKPKRPGGARGRKRTR
jgi:LysR substrate binding domain